MTLSEISHNKWVILVCPSCGKKEYIFNKVQVTQPCTCGVTDLEIIMLENWESFDFAKISQLSLKESGQEEVQNMPMDINEQLSSVITDKKLLREIMLKVEENIAEYLCEI